MSHSALGETKHTILVLLLDGEATAEILASKLTMNLSVVRRHLEGLAGEGLVEASFKRGGRGRPSKVYAISTNGRAKISSKYDLVAELLTVAAGRDLGDKKLGGLYSSAARVLAENVGNMDSEALLPVLTDFGFSPELRNGERGTALVSKNCPILKLAKQYPSLTCDVFHTVFLRAVLGNPGVALKQAIARGAAECIHEY